MGASVCFAPLPSKQPYFTKQTRRHPLLFLIPLFCFVAYSLFVSIRNVHLQGVVVIKEDNAADMFHYEYQDMSTPTFPQWPMSSPVVSIRALAGAMRSCALGYSGFRYHHYQMCNKVYIVDDQARLWASDLLEKGMDGRIKVMEPFLRDTIRSILWQPPTSLYPRVKRAVEAGGFGFMVNFNDTYACFRTNQNFIDRIPPTMNIFRGQQDLAQSTTAIPFFTLSSPIDCDTAYLIPNYQMITDSQQREQLVGRLGLYLREQLPFHLFYQGRQKAVAVWRGSATGNNNQSLNDRQTICEISNQYPELVDAKFVGKPKSGWINTEMVYGKRRMKAREFQAYRAIIDVDGNAWSSRFPRLLCYSSSVVLKVDPEHGDALSGTTKPWQHYIPVQRFNLTNDLVAKVRYVNDHPATVNRIIQTANRWCDEQLGTKSLQRHLLRILDHYLQRFEIQQHDDWSGVWMEEAQALRSEMVFSLVA